MAVRQAKLKSPRAEIKTNKIQKNKNKSDNKVLLIAQEIKFAKVLAGNDKKARDKILKHLKKWLTCRSSSTYDFTEQDFMRLWKGLFYCVWMSDKPLIQEDLCEKVSGLFDCFSNTTLDVSVLFFKCFLKTMADNWFGIDQHRIDKFLMLVRRMTRGFLTCIKQQDWSMESLSKIRECLNSEGGILSENHPRLSLGLQMHLTDCWMEEISKVSEGELNAEMVTQLVKPFAEYLCYGEDTRLASSINRNVFIHLIRQTDLGLEYQERLRAWKAAGFPGGSADAMERIELSDDEAHSDEEENEDITTSKGNVALDPRAGYVDTELPQLEVNGESIAKMLKEMLSDSRTTFVNRKRLRNIAESFETLASGTYPFKMNNLTLPNDPKFRLPKAATKAAELIQFEEDCINRNEDDDLKGMTKSQKRKFLMKQRKLLEAGNLNENDNDDTVKKPPAPKKARKSPKKIEIDTWEVEDVDANDLKSELTVNCTPSRKKNEKSGLATVDIKNLKENNVDKSETSKTSSNKKKDKKNKILLNSTPLNQKIKEKNGMKSEKKSENKKFTKTEKLISETKKCIRLESPDSKNNEISKSTKLETSSILTPASKKVVRSGSIEDFKKKKVEKLDTLDTSKSNKKNRHENINSTPANQKVKDNNDSKSEILSSKKSEKRKSTKTEIISEAKMSKLESPECKKNDTSKSSKLETPINKRVVRSETKPKDTPENKQITSLKDKKQVTPLTPVLKIKNEGAKLKASPNLSSNSKKDTSIKSTKPDSPSSTSTPLNKKQLNNGMKSKSLMESSLTNNTNVSSAKLTTPIMQSPANKKNINNTSKFKTPTSNNKNNSSKLDSSTSSTPGSKRVMIALKKTTSQGLMDYFKSVKQSPEIPFDTEKKPQKTSLKPNTMPSPINPFYKKKLKLNF